MASHMITSKPWCRRARPLTRISSTFLYTTSINKCGEGYVRYDESNDFTLRLTGFAAETFLGRCIRFLHNIAPAYTGAPRSEHAAISYRVPLCIRNLSGAKFVTHSDSNGPERTVCGLAGAGGLYSEHVPPSQVSEAFGRLVSQRNGAVAPL